MLIDGVDWRAPERRWREDVDADVARALMISRSRSTSAWAPTALSQRQQVVNVECYVLAR